MSNITFHDVDQNSDEWFELRAGHLTSSSLSKVMSNFGKAFGEPAKQLAASIALEQITGVPTESGYSNDAMARGHIEEPLARMLYEEETFCDVTNGGFFDCGFMGCSPDGLVGDEGVIEIKSAIPHIHYSRVKRQDIDPAYKWQCVYNLMGIERDWLDFISYCKDFPAGKQLYVFRMHKSQYKYEMSQVEERVAEFQSLVIQSRELIMDSTYTLMGAANA